MENIIEKINMENLQNLAEDFKNSSTQVKVGVSMLTCMVVGGAYVINKIRNQNNWLTYYEN